MPSAVRRVARIGDQRDQRRHVLRWPVARHQGFAGLGRILRGADQADDFVNVGNRNGEADQDVGAVARLAQQELGAARDHFLAEGDEGLQQILQVHLFRPAAVQRRHC